VGAGLGTAVSFTVALKIKSYDATCEQSIRQRQLANIIPTLCKYT